MNVQELIDALLKIEDKSRPVYISTGEDEYYMTVESVSQSFHPWALDGDGEAHSTIYDEATDDYLDVDDSTPGAFYPVLLEDR